MPDSTPIPDPDARPRVSDLLIHFLAVSKNIIQNTASAREKHEYLRMRQHINDVLLEWEDARRPPPTDSLQGMMDIPLEQTCQCTIEKATGGITKYKLVPFITLTLKITNGPDIGRKLFARFYNKSKLRHLGLPDYPDGFCQATHVVEVEIHHESNERGLFALPKITKLL